MDIVILIVGLALVLFGANILTTGSAGLAQRFRVSEFVIGLTVVAIGTSTPELVVSLFSAARGQSDLAIGNVVGSNLFNTFVILGVTSLIRPVSLTGSNMSKDIPFGVLASVVLLVAASDIPLHDAPVDAVTRNEGLLMLCFFGVFMAYTVFSAKSAPAVVSEDTHRQQKLWFSLLLVVGGLAALVGGGELFLDSATRLARRWGLSESVIAVTLVAGGTSLPELAASVAAAIRGKTGLALGNVVGSNVTNIFLVLGASATVSPLTLGGIRLEDMLMLLAASLLLFITAFTVKRKEVDRTEGIVFLLLYGAYIWWLLTR